MSQEAPRRRADVRILIVDEHPTVRESLRFVFAAAGIQRILEATACQDPLDALARTPVDLVLLDVALSDGQGLETLRRIKAISAATAVLAHSYQDSPRLLSQSLQAERRVTSSRARTRMR